MQVILLQDVANVGKKYQEVEVADGYGTNYLIPNGLAQVATDQTRNRYQKLQEQAAEKRRKEREKLAASIEEINDREVTITVERAGDQGQLFAGIYPGDIAEAINEEFNIDITGADIERDQPISKVGEEEIEVTILDTTVKVAVIVEAKNFTAEDPNAEEEMEDNSSNDAVSDEPRQEREAGEIPSEEQDDDSEEKN